MVFAARVMLGTLGADNKTRMQTDTEREIEIERARERERERATARQSDRETERQRDRETERQRDRETERQRDRETERQRDKEPERQRDRETDRQRHTHTHSRHTGVPTGDPRRLQGLAEISTTSTDFYDFQSLARHPRRDHCETEKQHMSSCEELSS